MTPQRFSSVQHGRPNGGEGQLFPNIQWHPQIYCSLWMMHVL